MFHWFRRKEQEPVDTVTEEQARFDGKLLSYVTKRVQDADGSTSEIVVGKDGRLCAVNSTISIICNEKQVFCAPAESTTCGELMSRNGVIVSGVNDLSGEFETLIAHFVYYR